MTFDKKTILFIICIFIIALLAGYFYADAAEKKLLADENARLVTNLAEEKKSLQKEIEKIRAEKRVCKQLLCRRAYRTGCR